MKKENILPLAITQADSTFACVAGQVYHIHVREFADHDVFYFRDYLIAHPETAKEYGELKQKLLTQFEHDRDGYTSAKGEFIGRITALARE